MREISAEQLKEILSEHELWLDRKDSGQVWSIDDNNEKADLHGVDLRGVDLRGVDFECYLLIAVFFPLTLSFLEWLVQLVLFVVVIVLLCHQLTLILTHLKPIKKTQHS
jgi:hypothetical protein